MMLASPSGLWMVHGSRGAGAWVAVKEAVCQLAMGAVWRGLLAHHGLMTLHAASDLLPASLGRGATLGVPASQDLLMAVVVW